MDGQDELDDRQLAAALRERADALTTDVADADAAFGVVRRRARTTRRWRGVAGGAVAAAAAVVGVLVVASVAGDDEVVRTPATAPVADTAAVPVPTTMVPPTSVAPATAATTATTPPPAPAPATGGLSGSVTASTTYDSEGGSITVRLASGTISLADDPAPAPGFSVRIDDNGPDRVRVRFELDELRSEIRVDLENGVLVPEITDG